MQSSRWERYGNPHIGWKDTHPRTKSENCHHTLAYTCEEMPSVPWWMIWAICPLSALFRHFYPIGWRYSHLWVRKCLKSAVCVYLLSGLSYLPYKPLPPHWVWVASSEDKRTAQTDYKGRLVCYGSVYGLASCFPFKPSCGRGMVTPVDYSWFSYMVRYHLSKSNSKSSKAS